MAVRAGTLQTETVDIDCVAHIPDCQRVRSRRQVGKLNLGSKYRILYATGGATVVNRACRSIEDNVSSAALRAGAVVVSQLASLPCCHVERQARRMIGRLTGVEAEVSAAGASCIHQMPAVGIADA